MLIGTPKEIKNHEYRVGLTPNSAAELVSHGHQVMIETNAGAGIGYSDDDYKTAGCTIVKTASEIFERADMVIKVKEPQPAEIKALRPGQILYTYLHLAADKEQTMGLLASGAICIAYETVTDRNGRLPLLAPMSEVAGRMSIQVGAHYLEKRQGGAGVLLGGVSGVTPGKVVVVGGGISGTAAARMAMGLLADVVVLDKSTERLAYLDETFNGRLKTAYASRAEVARHVKEADLVIGAVLIPGAAAPKVVSADMVKSMRKGSVVVDIAIDQGGCFATSKPTSHADPVYVEHGVIHYCVTNMPGAVAQTSTRALNNATLPFAVELANKGWKKAIADNKHLANGLNIANGKCTYKSVADEFGLQFTDPQSL